MCSYKALNRSENRITWEKKGRLAGRNGIYLSNYARRLKGDCTMIRFGIAGIPLSSKGRTLYDGVKDAHNLGLRALEVQFLRINSFEREVFHEEEGISARSLSGIMVTEVHTKKTGEWNSGRYALDHPLESGEMLRMLSIPIASDYQKLSFIGEVARELDVSLSIHTPHYMELTDAGKAGEESVRWLKWAALLGDALGTTHLVTYLGVYGDDPGESLENAIENLKKVRNWMKRNKIRMKIGVEASGWKDVLGSMDELMEICSKVPNTRPVLNFGHIHSREGGSLNTKEDFQAIFDMTKKYSRDGYYAHFTGVEHSAGYERQYTPIKRGDLKFEPLVEAILDGDFDVTIISSSPLIEHDAMYMKILMERQMLRRYNRRKEKKEEKSRAKPEKKTPVKKTKTPVKKSVPVQKKGAKN